MFKKLGSKFKKLGSKFNGGDGENDNADINDNININDNADNNADADVNDNVNDNVNTDADNNADVNDNVNDNVNTDADVNNTVNTDVNDNVNIQIELPISDNMQSEPSAPPMESSMYEPSAPPMESSIESPSAPPMESSSAPPMESSIESPSVPPIEDAPNKFHELIITHLALSIPIIIIICIIIIVVFSIIGHKLYKNAQLNADMKKNLGVNLQDCNHGINKAGTNCKMLPCAKSQRNTEYGNCTNYSKYCKLPKFKSVTAKNEACVLNCSYTGTYGTYHDAAGVVPTPVWLAGYKPVKAYSSKYVNSQNGACTKGAKCVANGSATNKAYCNDTCVVTASKHTSKGACTNSGCLSGRTHSKKACNESCPAVEFRHNGTIKSNVPANNAVFKHTAAGACGTNCGAKGITYLSKAVDKYACKITCPNSKQYTSLGQKKVSSMIVTNGANIKCKTNCEYGITNSVNSIFKCNDKCDYPNEQNTINGKCEVLSKNNLCNYGLTNYGQNKIGVWGYKAGKGTSLSNNPKMHGCFAAKANPGVNTLYKSGDHGELKTIKCTVNNNANGVSTKYNTKCNKICLHPSLSKAYTAVLTKNHLRYSDKNTCKSTCPYKIANNYLNCNDQCTGISINTHTKVSTRKAANNAYKVKCTDKYNGKVVANLCSNTFSGKCKINTKCYKYGVNKNGTGCNSGGKCANPAESTVKTIWGGTKYRNYYYTDKGKCNYCDNGANYNETGCNTADGGVGHTANETCFAFTAGGKCDNKATGSGADTAGKTIRTKIHGFVPGTAPCNNQTGSYVLDNWRARSVDGAGCYQIGPGLTAGVNPGMNGNYCASKNAVCVNCNDKGRTKLFRQHSNAAYQVAAKNIASKC